MSESSSRDLRGTRPIFQLWTTVAYTVLWAALMVEGWAPLLTSDPTSWLVQPLESAWRIVNRDIEIVEAAGSEQSPTRVLLTSRDAAIASGVSIQREVLGHLEDAGADELELDRARVHLAVLLAESGALEDASSTAELVIGIKGLAEGLRFAYGAKEPSGSLEALAIYVALREGAIHDRLGDRLVARLGRRVGAIEAAEQLDRDLAARAAARRLRWDALLGVNLLLALMGLAVVVGGGFRRSAPTGPLQPPPWSTADGLGLLVRADFWSRLYFVAIVYGLPSPQSFAGEVLNHMGTFFASLPLVWLCRHYLLRSDSFGLVPVRGSVRWLAGITLVAISVDLIGTYAIGWTTWTAGVHGHWTEGFDEILVWGSQRSVVLASLDYVLWAPLFEELAFRGLLYTSLRARFGVVAAALLSSGVFAVLHFYSAAGFLVTFWSGLVWALTFERTRSLLPGIAAHVVYNALYVAHQLLIYR